MIGAILASMCLVGCTTTRELQHAYIDPANYATELKAGDDVVVGALNGKTYELEVIEVGADHFLGRKSGGVQVKMYFAAIKTLQVERFSPGKTAGLTFTTVAVVALVALLITIAIQAIFDCWSDIDGDDEACG